METTYLNSGVYIAINRALCEIDFPFFDGRSCTRVGQNQTRKPLLRSRFQWGLSFLFIHSDQNNLKRGAEVTKTKRLREERWPISIEDIELR